MKRGDIYHVLLDPTRGKEQRGARPVIIVSPTNFNKVTQLPIVLPITNGGDFVRRIGFSVPLTGLKTTGIVRCDQPRVLDINARDAKWVEIAPDHIMMEILAKMSTLFDPASI